MSETGSLVSDSLSASSGIIGVRAEDRNSVAEKFRAKVYEFYGNICDRKRRTLSNILSVLELITFLSLCFSDLLAYWGEADKYLDKISVLKITEFSNSFYEILLGCILTYLILMAVLGLISFAAVSRGEEEMTKSKWLFQHMQSLIPVFYAPFLGILVATISCDFESGTRKFLHSEKCFNTRHIIETSFASLGIIILLISGLGVALFDFEWLPHPKSHLSSTNPRHELIMYLTKTIVALFYALQQQLSPFAAGAVYGGVLVLGNGALVASTFYFLPFHKSAANVFYVAFFSFTSCTSLVRLIGVLSGKSSYIFPVIWLVLSLVSIPILCGLTTWRLRSISGLANLFSVDSKFPFKRDFEVEIATRHAYYDDDDEKSFERAELIYTVAIDLFPGSAIAFISNCVLLSTHSDDAKVLAIAINRAGRHTKPTIDYHFVLFCADRRRKKILYANDGGSEEISKKLKDALRHQEHCRRSIKSFWHHLLKEEDLNSLPELVASIEHSERRAEKILQRLSSKYPKSSRVLRTYGIFLEEIKNDFEVAQSCFIAADEVEEERSRRHRKKKSKKSKKSHDVVEPSDTPKPVKDNFMAKPNDDDETASQRGVRFETASLHSSRTSDRRRQIDRMIEDKLAARGKGRRSDIAKFKKYKASIESNRSGAHQRLSVSIALSLFILFMDLCGIYTGIRVVEEDYEVNVKVLGTASDIQTSASHILSDCRFIQLATSEEEVSSIVSSVHHYLDLLESSLSFILTNNAFIHNKSILYDPIWSIREYVPSTPPSRIFYNFNYIDMINKMIASAITITGIHYNTTLSPDQQRAFQFLFENGSVQEASEALASDAKDQTLIYAKYLNITLLSSLGISFFVVGITFLLFFYPSIRKIRAERSEALKLFLTIPKSTLLFINQQMSDEEASAKDSDSETEDLIVDQEDSSLNTSVGIPILKQILVRFVTTLSALMAVVTIMFIMGMVVNIRYGKVGVLQSFGDIRRSLVTLADFSSRELSLNDTLTWENGLPMIMDLFNKTIIDLRISHHKYIFGDSETGAPGALKLHENLEYMLFEVNCTLPGNASCRGVNMLINEFLSDAEGILNSNSSAGFSLDNVFISRINSVTQGLEALLYESERVTDKFLFDAIEQLRLQLSAVFGIAVPALIIAYLLIKPLEKKIQEENARTMKMLLMIPIDVIDSVPAIKEYLESGSQMAKGKKWRAALEETVARNKAVIDASADAIIVADTKGTIVYFNPAAERLFGYLTHEVMGQNIRMLTPDNIAVHHDEFLTRYLTTREARLLGSIREVEAKRKTGENIPVSLSLSSAQVGESLWFTAFIRDISGMKSQENALIKQKEMSDKLLQTILPKQIAEILASEGGLGLDERPIIAESYKEATILFADIVGFTKLSSKITASELIYILNTLFSRWDKACEKYGVEKIKTIGDCYMVVSGVPDRRLDHAESLLEFAIEMLKMLDDFNSEFGYELKIRIGMNTGPLVGGVIGFIRVTFDVWGDAVNVASRMESTGLEGRIQVSQSTFEKLQSEFIFEERGAQEVKGKGKMLTYLYKERKYIRTKSGNTRRRPSITPPPHASKRPIVSESLQVTNPKKTVSEALHEVEPSITILDK